MIKKIVKEFRFEASHQLNKPGCNYGKCENQHGHSYIMRIHLISNSGKIRSDGMIMNFVDLKKIVEDNIIEYLDHSFLNESFYKMICDHFDDDVVDDSHDDIIKRFNTVTTCELMSEGICIILSDILSKTHIDVVSAVGVELFETATSSCYSECNLKYK